VIVYAKIAWKHRAPELGSTYVSPMAIEGDGERGAPYVSEASKTENVKSRISSRWVRVEDLPVAVLVRVQLKSVSLAATCRSPRSPETKDGQNRSSRIAELRGVRMVFPPRASRASWASYRSLRPEDHPRVLCSEISLGEKCFVQG
jgi:hypothetical protein